MINWREGKAGFVGSAKRLIKGFFSYSYSKTSEVVLPPESSFSLFSIMDSSGQGINSGMDTTGEGVTSSMTGSNGVVSIMDGGGDGVASSIDTTGAGVDSIV